jgi:HlyD family secretion protein
MRRYLHTCCLLILILILGSCKEHSPRYNGYIDADFTYISSDFSGQLSELAITRGQFVKKNQLIFKLEKISQEYAISTSHLSESSLSAQREEILAQLHYNEINLQRTLQMKKDHAASQNDVDVAKKELAVSKDQLISVDAQIKSAVVDTLNKKWLASRKEGHAVDAGLIYDTYYTQGEFVPTGQPVASLITKDHIKIIFFVPEKNLSQLSLGTSLKVSADGTPQLATVKISYISKVAQYTSPLIYSREDRATLVFRVEAKFENPDLKRVHLGQPVTLELVT